MPVIISGSTGISGTDGSAATPAVQGTDTNTGMFFPAADQIAFAEGGTEVMRIDASGNVGIGTTTPGAPLDVNGCAQVVTNASAGFGLRVASPSGSASPGIVQFTNNPVTDQWFALAALSQNVLAFRDGGSIERARITNTNFLVGTNSAFDVTAGATTQLSGQCAVFAAGSPNTVMSFYNSTQAARVGFIGTNGNSTSYNSGSDYRLKENVVGIAGALDAVQSMRPVRFTWKYSPTSGVFSGFIAHELQEVWPEAVSGEKDAMCGDGETPDYQAVDQSKLVPLLVAAVQELTAKLEAAEARIATLEAR